MALLAPTGAQFENPEPGSYVARCYGFIDLGTQPHKSTHASKEDWVQRDVRFLFELPFNLMTGRFNKENEGKPFVVSITTKFSLAPGAKFFKMITGWRGKALTPDEAKTFPVRKMIGSTVRLSLIENGEYTNIDSFSKIAANEAASVPPMISTPIYFSLDPDEFKQEIFDGFSDKNKAKISSSPEYIELFAPKKPVSAPSVGRSAPISEDEAANLVSRKTAKEPAVEDEDPF